MKSVSILLFAFFTVFTVSAQQTNKIDDALLMEYFQGQRYLEATDYLKKNFPEPITDRKVLSRLAYASQMAKKLPDAEAYYQRVYDMDTTNNSILFNIAGINLRRGNLPKAEEYYKRIISRDTSNFIVYSQLGNIAQAKNDTAAVIMYYEKANHLNPFDTDLAADLSDFYTGMKQYDKALKVLNKAAESDPDNVIILLSTEKLVYSQSKWPEVVEISNKLLNKGTRSGLILTHLGIAYYNLNNYACGAETFASLTGMEQNEYSFYYTALCYKGLKDNIQAVNFFNMAIFQGISPNIATYYGEIGGIEEKIDKYKKAALAYQKALQFKESSTLYYLLASLYDTKLKDKANAVKYYKKYLESKPSGKQTNTYLAYAKSRIEQLNN